MICSGARPRIWALTKEWYYTVKETSRVSGMRRARQARRRGLQIVRRDSGPGEGPGAGIGAASTDR